MKARSNKKVCIIFEKMIGDGTLSSHLMKTQVMPFQTNKEIIKEITHVPDFKELVRNRKR